MIAAYSRNGLRLLFTHAACGMLTVMRILQACSATEIGGGERHVIDLTRALIERGHELHLAVRPQAKIKSELASLPIVWHELPLRNALDIVSAKKLKKIIVQQNIEIVHAHVARDYTICGAACKKTAAKLFLTRHHFNPIKANFLYQWTISQTQGFIAVSSAVRAEIQQAFPKLTKRISVIPNWIDSQVIASMQKVEARNSLSLTGKFAVGMIGQITPLKGQKYFIQAAQQIARDDVDFLIIGAPQTDHDKKYYQQLVNDYRQFITQGKLRFAGAVPDIATRLAAFDIIVVPSINEGFSLVVIEAMAAGCAIIASRAGGITDLIENSVSGILTSPESSAQIAEALAELLTNPELRLRLGAQARSTARAKYSRETVIDQIENLYREKTIDRIQI